MNIIVVNSIIFGQEKSSVKHFFGNGWSLNSEVIQTTMNNSRFCTCIWFPYNFVVISTFFRIFPWGCISGFLSRIVLDAAPKHDFQQFIPAALSGLNKKSKKKKSTLNNNNDSQTPNYNKISKADLIMRPITTIAEERNL